MANTIELDRATRIKYIIILGFISMLTPLSIDMYLPSFLMMSQEFAVDQGMVQLTLITYVSGFAVGQLFYGPISDTVGRKPILLLGMILYTIMSVCCALAHSIDSLIIWRLMQGLTAASSAVVINALMRDLFNRDEFSRMMSFVTLVMTVAPLLAPIIGGWLLLWFSSWRANFWLLSIAAFIITILLAYFIPESLAKENRQSLSLQNVGKNLYTLFKHKQVMCYIMASAFAFSGLFSFLTCGPFVYMELNGVAQENFGYYFALNVFVMITMTVINSRYVRRVGIMNMIKLGLLIQCIMITLLLISLLFNLSFACTVIGVAGFAGCISMISSNSMALILEEFPMMAGTAASLAGAVRFGTGAIVGSILSHITQSSAWPMVSSMLICFIIASLLYWLGQHSTAK